MQFRVSRPKFYVALPGGREEVRWGGARIIRKFVASCCILLHFSRYCKVGWPGRVIAGAPDGEGRILVHPKFFFIFVPFCSISPFCEGLAVGSRLCIVWYMRSRGDCLSNRGVGRGDSPQRARRSRSGILDSRFRGNDDFRVVTFTLMKMTGVVQWSQARGRVAVGSEVEGRFQLPSSATIMPPVEAAGELSAACSRSPHWRRFPTR